MDTSRRKQKAKILFDAVFPQDKEWNTYFFEHIDADETLRTVDVDCVTASCLFVLPFAFTFHRQPVPFAYIYGAATHPRQRGKGLMTELLKTALAEQYEKGTVFCGLIPAEKLLFSYYERFGFAPVVLYDTERYVSVHQFAIGEGLRVVAPAYEALQLFESIDDSVVVHSADDFERMMYDYSRSGAAVQVNFAENQPVALCFARKDSDGILVNYLAGTDETARQTAIAAVKDSLGDDLPLRILTMPGGRNASLHRYAMLRIVNVEAAFSAIAKTHPEVRQIVRVTDKLITANTGIYNIAEGVCQKLPIDCDAPKPTLDVSVEVLTKILFSGEAIGRVFELPTRHPSMRLMPD